MASKSISGWKNDWASAGDRTFTIEVTETSYDAVANTSNVKWTVSVSGGNNQSMDTYIYASVNGSAVINEWLPATSDGGQSWNGFPANVGSKSGTSVISHDADGKKSISFYIEGYAVVYSTKSASGSLTLTNLDRTDPVVTQADITDIDVDRFTISATSNANCNSWEYSLNNGSSWTVFSTTDGMSASTSVTGLTLNTNYTVLIRAKKTLNGLYGVSGAKSAKTLGSSTITSVTNTEFGSNCVVTWTPLDPSFIFKVSLVIEGKDSGWAYDSNWISPASTDPQTHTVSIPINIAAVIPNDTSIIGRAYLYTYTEDEILIGSPSVVPFTVTVPAAVVPTISSVTLEEGTLSGFNLFVKSLSTAKATVNASGIYGSTITNIIVNFGGITYTANSSHVAVSDILQVAGTMTVQTTVTDSRERTTTNTQTITVYDYFKPTASMNITQTGTTVVTTVTGSIAPVNNTNAKSLVIQRKRLSDDTVTTYTVDPLSSYDYSVAWTQTVADIETESYEYTASVTDTIQTVSVKQQTAVICISRLAGGRGVTFFEEASQEGFWVRNIRHDITAAEYIALATKLAQTYSQKAYAVGEWVKYNDAVYQCSTAITVAEAWNAAHWTAIASADMRMFYVFLNLGG